MRRVSMATRNELVAAVIERYSKGTRAEKGCILDEFVAITGSHRKHAMRFCCKVSFSSLWASVSP